MNIETPECTKWFDDISKGGLSVSSAGEVKKYVYDPSKPYDFEYVPEEVNPNDFPRMSGVIKLSSGKLVAVDQQGNYMLSVSEKDCRMWLDGYRPFNYFAQGNSSTNQSHSNQQSTERVSTSEPENQNTETSSL